MPKALGPSLSPRYYADRTAASALPLAVERQEDAGQRTTRDSRRAPLLILLGYLAASLALTWRLWAHPATMAPSNGSWVLDDIYVNVWGMRYAATAIAHGSLPSLITTAVNAPQGINLMWNTTMLLPSVLLAPVTLLAGPQASLDVLTTLGFAGSAATMFVVLRRWEASTGAAALGGAIFGFSPALLIAAEDHYPFQFAVLLPLILDAALRLITGRGRPVRTGIWLGLLISAQIFLSEEWLLDTALVGVLMVAVLAASRPSAVLSQARTVVTGMAVAAGATLVICGYPLWVQFHGPLTEHGSPWNPADYRNYPADFVTAPDNVLLHGNWLHFIARTGQLRVGDFSYLGWPLLVVLLAATVVYWRDIRIRMSGVTFVILELFSLSDHPITVFGWHISGVLLPWHWMLHVPLVNQALPNRLPLLADGAAAAVLAFTIDRVVDAVRRGAQDWRRPAIGAAAAVAIAAAILPIIPAAVPAAALVPVPTGWQAVMARLHLDPGARVVVLPLDGPHTMGWQAVTGEPFSVVAGYCIAPAPNGQAAVCGNRYTLTSSEWAASLQLGKLASGVPRIHGPSVSTMTRAISNWQAGAVVTAAGSHSAIATYLTRFFGPPTASQGRVLGWRLSSGWQLRARELHDHRPRRQRTA